ncbi:type III polyketide synthase [Schumannella sp. 10F1B-5-1]|uniref:type III polyketide synthase n=1 Tax=Schumannella sp. 10F1B-5-1 TaxID=2590780 RepID=UPI001131D024|nr:3-oxoacyl-[acyl-carrier-protein] synthase III C-terminal domain-containing protein [Schumannella sp. 10F1B-5-1]TPW78492.1 type III polyketide synthase [Schumannella sp. 10F1B-5-1]
MSRIVAVAPVLPPHSAAQGEITAELVRALGLDAPELRRERAVFERMHAGTRIHRRSTVLPLARYADLDFDEANRVWRDAGADLGEGAVRAALAQAGLAPGDVDHFFFTSVTGAAAPSIDALLAGRLGFRRELKRIPSFGLGCVAGAAGLARVHDYLAGHPDGVAVVLAVELCSLTLQRDDRSVANAVATGLFGDGAAAVVVVGDAHPLAVAGARASGGVADAGAGAGGGADAGAGAFAGGGMEIVDTLSSLYPDSEGVLGFDLGGTGFRIVLTAEVAGAIDANFAADVDALLTRNALTRADVGSWVAHAGGPRVLEAFAAALELPDGALDTAWQSLAESGNLSSASVLHVLARTPSQPPGTWGLLFALGPGVTSEIVLLRWGGGVTAGAVGEVGAVGVDAGGAA